MLTNDTLQDLLKQEITKHKTTTQNLVTMTQGRNTYYDKYIETLQKYTNALHREKLLMELLNITHTTLKDGTQVDYLKLEGGFAVTIKDIYGQMVDFDITFSELKNITEDWDNTI